MIRHNGQILIQMEQWLEETPEDKNLVFVDFFKTN